MTGFVLMIAGPSGVGKGTIVEQLLAAEEDIELSISCTTRVPRGHEEHGVNYFFLSDEQFEEKIEKDEFLEWANVHTKRYGTDAVYVNSKVAQGKIVLLEIDFQGVEQIVKKINNAVTIFIEPPSMDELEKRLRGRGTESEEQIAGRMQVAQEEMNHRDLFHYKVVNDSLDKAVTDVKNIIESERRKRYGS